MGHLFLVSGQRLFQNAEHYVASQSESKGEMKVAEVAKDSGGNETAEHGEPGNNSDQQPKPVHLAWPPKSEPISNPGPAGGATSREQMNG